MSSQGLIVVVASVLVLGGVFMLLRGGDEPQALPSEGAAGAGNAPAAPIGAATGDAVPTEAAPSTAPDEAERTALAVATQPGDIVCVVAGRLVDPAGAPRPGVEVSQVNWQARGGDIDVPMLGERRRWEDLEKVRTDREGRFRLSIQKGRQGRLRLDLETWLFQKGEHSFSTAQGDAALGDLVVIAPARIRGLVVDAKGTPLPGVAVMAHRSANVPLFGSRSESKTDANGEFTVGALTGGPWTLRTASARHLPKVQEVELADEQQLAGVRLVLDQGQSIAGQVIDDRGLPVAGIRVGSMRREQRAGISIERFAPDEATTTDQHGFFVLGGLSGTAATVRALGRGFTPVTEAGVAVGTGDLLLRVSRRGSIAGVLKDTNGQPIAGSRVTARAPRGGAMPGPGIEEAELVDALDADLPGAGARAVTAADGTFRIDDVDPGVVAVRARGKTHRPTERPGIAVQPAQNIEGVVLTAEIGAVVAALVVDEAGAPVEGAKVEVRQPKPRDQGDGTFMSRAVRIDDEGHGPDVHFGAGPQQLGTGTTDKDGRVEIAGLPAGEAVITAAHERFADAPATSAVLPASGTTNVNLAVLRPGIASLLVTLPTGEAVTAGYTVHGPIGKPEDERDRKGKTAADGTARIEQLQPGDYWAELRLPAKPRSFGGGAMVLAEDDQQVSGSRIPFRVEAGGLTDVALRMPILAKITGKVTSVDGAQEDVVVELVAKSDSGSLPGADLGGHNAHTNADGEFVFADVLAGSYRLRWGKADQLVKASRQLDVPANTTTVRQDLELRYGKVRVQVMSKIDGEPIEGAEVELAEAAQPGAPARREQRVMMFSMSIQGDDGGETTSMTMGASRATTDVEGVAEIADVPPGRYTVRVRHDRHAEKELGEQTVLELATTDCGRVEMDAAGRIRGRVLDSTGKPARMALVTCAKVGTTGDDDRQPAMTGAFTFAGLTPGKYTLRAQPMGPGAKPGEPVEVEVVAGKTASGVEVRLPPE